MKLRLPDAVYRAFYLQTTMIMDDLTQISNNEWYGVLNTMCGKRIQYRIIDRKDRIQEAARLLGQIGGQAGRGKKKVRGDSNYYQLLRLKGLEKRRKKHENNNIIEYMNVFIGFSCKAIDKIVFMWIMQITNLGWVQKFFSHLDIILGGNQKVVRTIYILSDFTT